MVFGEEVTKTRTADLKLSTLGAGQALLVVYLDGFWVASDSQS